MAKRLERTGLKTIKLLREKKLNQGRPFMINSEILPPEQCYMEYPDGSIKIVEANVKELDFIVIEELDSTEINRLKRKLKLI
jgi:hypothetical protein